jgi:uncharacterized CHY-type Zn-finger protein
MTDYDNLYSSDDDSEKVLFHIEMDKTMTLEEAENYIKQTTEKMMEQFNRSQKSHNHEQCMLSLIQKLSIICGFCGNEMAYDSRGNDCENEKCKNKNGISVWDVIEKIKHSNNPNYFQTFNEINMK